MVLVWLIAGVGLLLLWLVLARWFAVADPRTLVYAGKVLAVVLLGGLLAYLLLSGRGGWLLGLLPFLLPFLLRRGAWAAASGAGLFSRGGRPRTSGVRTRLLDMRLDHDSGDLDGQVLEGPFTGRMLSELAEADLLALYRQAVAADRKSARLLESYLDRRQPDWRERQAAGEAQAAAGGSGDAADDAHSEPAAGAAMTPEEAYRILGLEPGASGAEIRAAYHRLIASVHPDRGGSSFLAAQVNRARDLLLGVRPRR